MTSVAVLGSTGSVGTQALDVVRDRPGRFSVQVPSGAHSSVDVLARAGRGVPPEIVVLVDESAAAERARRRLPAGTELWVGR